MKVLIATVFLLIFSFEICEAHRQCLVPTTIQLQTFFDNDKLWTEVLRADSNMIASRDIIRLDIDFLNPKKSKISKGNKSMGSLSGFCTNEKADHFFISTTLTDIILSKTQYGSIESKLTFFGFSFRYYYLPDGQVIKSNSKLINNE